MAKKVFISYGHDRNVPLVEQICQDLAKAGYEPWFDTRQIEHGDDWRRTITDGLKESDWVLGFLSKHSVRDPGVCLDELGIALHVKGGAIATVLLEADAAPPVSVSHIQWLDMQDWAEREAQGGSAWEHWYRGKFDQILAVLADPARQSFTGEIERLEARLMPLSQQARIGTLIEGFVGRRWLLQRLEAWRTAASPSRLLWIAGAAGTGKSAFAAWLGHFGRANVIGLNLCDYSQEERRDAGRIIRTLAFQIATRLPDYRRLLLDRLTLQDPDGEEVRRKSPASLFDWLLTDLLRLVVDGGRSRNHFLVIIDGLDETVLDGRSLLGEVLVAQVARLPAWLRLVVTSRPDEPIRRQFNWLQPLSIAADSADNQEDVRDYVRHWLAQENSAAAGRDALVARIVAAAEGNFLYLRMLREAVTETTMRLDAPEGLPQGLAGLYERWFHHRFPNPQSYEAVLPLMAVLVAAEHAVPEAWLVRIFGWSLRDKARMLDNLVSLFERRRDGVAAFHKSLRDWLIDDRAAGPRFVVDPVEGADRLLAALWSEFLRWARQADRGTLDAFCVAELPAQVKRKDSQDLRDLLAAVGNVSTVWTGLVKVAEAQVHMYAWEAALAWWDMLARLAAAAGAHEWQAYALERYGDVASTIGRSAEALQSFRAQLAIREGLAAADPGNAGWRRDLWVSLNKIGDVLVQQGNLTEALTRFRAGLAIAEALAAADPGNAGWRRDLSVSFDRVGNVLVAQGNLPEALKSFRAGLAIREGLAAADPGNAGWRRDLSVSLNKIGDVLVQQGNLPEALQSFSKGLAIREGLAAADPGNAGWRRDLSVSFERVGDVLVEQGNLPEALQRFRAGLAISEGLAAADPGNAGWQRDLSVSLDKIGAVLVRQGNLPEALTRFRAGLAIAEALAAADPGNAGWQRDLIVSYVKLSETDVGEAKAWLSKAIRIVDAMDNAGQLAPRDAWLPAELTRRLAALSD